MNILLAEVCIDFDFSIDPGLKSHLITCACSE
jgi:hypothetical protein